MEQSAVHPVSRLIIRPLVCTKHSRDLVRAENSFRFHQLSVSGACSLAQHRKHGVAIRAKHTSSCLWTAHKNVIDGGTAQAVHVSRAEHVSRLC